jgi:type IV pilus assembly protein PilW
MRSQLVASRRMAGFSLVEILVAMVIGLIATLVVMQVFFGSEARGRTAAGNADSQSNGVMTFYQMQSHIQKAGYGLDSIGLYNCLVSWTPASGAPVDKAITLAPVSVNPVGTKAGVKSLLLPAGDANTDTLLVVYGNGNGQPQGNPIIDTAALVYTMQMPGSFAVGDRVILALDTAPGTCGATVLNIDRVAAVDATTVTLVTGGAGVAMFNLGKGPNGVNVTPTSANPSNGPSILAYAVRNGNLTVCDFTVHDCSLDANKTLTTVWVPIASNIVGMRATYWNDTSVAWDGSSSTSNQTQPATACLWAKVKAVSLVLVARNTERDKDVVTTTTLNGVSAADANKPVWDQDGVAPLVANTGALGPDAVADEEWKHYRYKTFQALIPLRNVNWMGRPTGC